MTQTGIDHALISAYSNLEVPLQTFVGDVQLSSDENSISSATLIRFFFLVLIWFNLHGIFPPSVPHAGSFFVWVLVGFRNHLRGIFPSSVPHAGSLFWFGY